MQCSPASADAVIVNLYVCGWLLFPLRNDFIGLGLLRLQNTTGSYHMELK